MGAAGILLGCWWFLVLMLCSRPFFVWGFGCGCVLGLQVFEGKRACCRVHVQHRLGVSCLFGVGLACRLWGSLCGVLWLVWWVVGDLYSGCEHLDFFVVLFSFVGHSVDALASRADEGRCGLRYASGSWRASFDPRVSEWGNLTRVVLGYHMLKFDRCVGGTRGSETSQYP